MSKSNVLISDSLNVDEIEAKAFQGTKKRTSRKVKKIKSAKDLAKLIEAC